MSYDLKFGVEVKGADGVFIEIGCPEYDSPTYNLGELFRACTGWNYEQGKWYKLAEVEPMIKHGIVELIEHEENYVKYEAENGWGNTADARKVLVSIMAWVSDTRDAGKIPIECIWIAW